MPQSLSAYYEADKGLTLGGFLKVAACAAIGFAIAFYAVPSSAALAPAVEIAAPLTTL
jgi:hypothetical protein